MKYAIWLLITSMWLWAAGCGECGKDTNLGRKHLGAQSIADWFPYKNVDVLMYRNSNGETITLQLEERNEEMINWFFRFSCFENDIDNASENFRGESLYVQYEGIYNDVNHRISVSLHVCQLYYGYEPDELMLQDLATYSFDFYHTDKGNFGGGVYIHTVNYRGNPVPDDSTGTDHPEMVREIEFNGTTYQDVWIFSRENTHSVYIQKGKGIIAYEGPEDEIWERQ